ncbi:MAG: hypothetical protein KAG89_02145 [Fulvimarina manganoxydans]|uniref:hypothetical protein n=1 Tax=Fulvimarina manganoxydans TaxID=937218 RepID=UPI002352E02B|nr:hypothetical protein [Fulvimarina manganoxydans]MCK5930946.1 hypothetical protein [Fulvimarina manganoxydans]
MSDPNSIIGTTGRSDAERVEDRLGTEARSARAEGERARKHLGEEARAFRDRARDKAYEGADRAKEGVSSSLDDFAAAVRKASDELGERDQSMASHLVREVAGGLEHASRNIGGRDVGELTRSVASFARERPGVFMAGMALAGLALGRFVRASGEHEHEDERYRRARRYDEPVSHPGSSTFESGEGSLRGASGVGEPATTTRPASSQAGFTPSHSDWTNGPRTSAGTGSGASASPVSGAPASAPAPTSPPPAKPTVSGLTEPRDTPTPAGNPTRTGERNER